MKKGSLNFNKFFHAVFSMLLTALGFSCSDSAGDEPCMYGSPYSDFEVKGTVVDENDQPVPNAKIAIRQGLKINGKTEWHDSEWYLSTATDCSGKYSLKSSGLTHEVRIVCTPPDDSLEADSTETELNLKDDGRNDPWYFGSATVEHDFRLKVKKD